MTISFVGGGAFEGLEITAGFESPGDRLSVGSATMVGFESPGCPTIVGFTGVGEGIVPVPVPGGEVGGVPSMVH